MSLNSMTIVCCVYVWFSRSNRNIAGNEFHFIFHFKKRHQSEIFLSMNIKLFEGAYICLQNHRLRKTTDKNISISICTSIKDQL